MILASLILAAPMQSPDPAALISKMFAYYYDAKSLSGKIKMTQAFQQRTAVIETHLQFQWPAKIYIRQNMNGPAGPDRWLVTGDGEGFTYDAPRVVSDHRTNNRLYEPVQYIPPPPKYKGDLQMPKPPPHDVRSIYRAVCVTIGDRSLPIDVAFGRKEDLEFIRGQISTVENGGTKDLNGVICHIVKGTWKDHPKDSITHGEYELWLTEDGQMKRFARAEDVSVKTEELGAPVAQGKVITIWDIDLKKDAGVDNSLFKLVLRY